MKRKNKETILKVVAIFSIYLILSLTFFTARSFAVLNYDISGKNHASGFAKSDQDTITLYVNASSAVSLQSETLGDVPLDGCTNTTTGISCKTQLEPITIDEGIESIPFVIVQADGTPASKNGILYIDRIAPNYTYLEAVKQGSGINITYEFRDYLSSIDELDSCKGSGIASVEIILEGRTIHKRTFDTNNCTISGSYYHDMTGSDAASINYQVIAKDRAGNYYNCGSKRIEGDFRAPSISETFKILRQGEEINILSTVSEITADIVVEVEDANISTVVGNLTQMNVNPAVNHDPTYINAVAQCVHEGGSVSVCTFKDVRIRPSSKDAKITITAKDIFENKDVKEVRGTFDTKDSAGGVTYLGPSKDHCTESLEQCYVKPGRQLIYAELDSSSSLSKSIINLGINSDKTFAICRLNSTWRCTGIYNFQTDSEMYIAPSVDDYGNMIESTLERTIHIDSQKPVNVTGLYVQNSNNNLNCSISADELEIRLNVTEDTPILKMHVNTSEFTSYNIQYGICEPKGNDLFECAITIKGFSSNEASKLRNVVINDLAGNTLEVPYQFEVCKSTSEKVPNVIFDVVQDKIPDIDRRTASKIGVKTYIPLTMKVDPKATLMYINVEKCTAQGPYGGLNVMGSGHTFIPSYGSRPTLALIVGNNGANIPEGILNVNCTMSARVKIGRTVYMQAEKQDFVVQVNAYTNNLGTVEKNSADEINEVRANLRELDKKIKRWDNTIGWLGKVCSIAESIGKLNAVLQAVKNVIYFILIGVQTAFPAAAPTCENIWQAVDKLRMMHKIVNKYIWPGGIFPGKAASPFTKGAGQGMFDKDSATSPGFILKWLCMLYTCKHYDVGTYMQAVSELADKNIFTGENKKGELAAKGYGVAEDEKRKYTDADGEHLVSKDANNKDVDEQGHYIKELDANGDGRKEWVKTDLDGNLVDDKGRYIMYDKEAKGYVYQTQSGATTTKASEAYTAYDKGGIDNIYGKPIEYEYDQTKTEFVNTHDYYTDPNGNVYEKLPDNLGEDMRYGRVDLYYEKQTEIMSKTTIVLPQAQFQSDIRAQNEMLMDSLAGHQFMVNPYRSVHYDFACVPAYIYNLKKERQIDCMYLRCLQEQDGALIPKVMCDGNYKVNKCLYLDSAEYVLGGTTFIQNFARTLPEALENAAIGFVIGKVQKKLCRDDYSLQYTPKTTYQSFWPTACGVLISYQSLREIGTYMKNPFDTSSFAWKGKSSGEVDYCEGLDYQNDYATAEADWFNE